MITTASSCNSGKPLTPIAGHQTRRVHWVQRPVRLGRHTRFPASSFTHPRPSHAAPQPPIEKHKQMEAWHSAPSFLELSPSGGQGVGVRVWRGCAIAGLRQRALRPAARHSHLFRPRPTRHHHLRQVPQHTTPRTSEEDAESWRLSRMDDGASGCVHCIVMLMRARCVRRATGLAGFAGASQAFAACGYNSWHRLAALHVFLPVPPAVNFYVVTVG